MPRAPSLLRTSLAAFALSLALSACVVVPGHPYYGRPYYAGPVVALAPPAPQVEVMGVAPYPGYVWLGGYWNWYGGRYAWVPGRWAAPRPGYRWVGPRWVSYGGGWRMERGGWRRR